MIIAGLSMAFLGMKKSKDREMLESTGVEVQGAIVNASESTKVGRRSGTKLWVYVKYEPKEGSPVTRGFEVTPDYFASISKGDEIVASTAPIIYSPSDPKNAIIRNGSIKGGSRSATIMLYIAGAGGVLFLLSLLIGGKSARS